MINTDQYNAGFIQEKRKDLEFLQGIDYCSLSDAVERALQSGSSQKLLEAKSRVESYESGVIKDRRKQIPVKHIDDEISRLAAKYLEIKSSLAEGVQRHLSERESRFRESYSSGSPNIQLLKQLSEDYANFEGSAGHLDKVMLQYAGFSRKWDEVETLVDEIIADYVAVRDNGGIQAIKSRAQDCKIALEKVEQGAPKRFLRGVHKAYRYQNPLLDKLLAELSCFEKNDFAGRRNEAAEQASTAADFIELLKAADEKEVCCILEEYSRCDLSADLDGVQGTIYFGNLPHDHAGAVQGARAVAKERALGCLQEFKKSLKLHNLLNVADNHSTTDLKNQGRILKEEYGETAELLYSITGDSTINTEMDACLRYVSERIAEIQKEDLARKAAAEEVAKAGQKLAEVQNELEKEKKKHETKGIESEKRLEELAKEKEALASSLEEERRNKEALQRKVGEVLDKCDLVAQQIKESSSVLARDLTAQMNNKLRTIEGKIAAELSSRSEIDRVSAESLAQINEAYAKLCKAIAEKPGLTEEQARQMLAPVYARFDELKDVSATQKQSIMGLILEKLNLKKQEQKQEGAPSAKPGTETGADEVDLGQLFQEKRGKPEQADHKGKLPIIDLDELIENKYKEDHPRRAAS